MDTLSKQVTNEVSSVREVQRTTGIPKTSVFHILQDVFNLCPYKLQSLNQFLPNGTAKGKEFVRWALMKASSDAQWLVNILWTGEAHFSLHGTVNTHNCRIWAQGNPNAYTGEPLCSIRVTFLVWLHFVHYFELFFLWGALWKRVMEAMLSYWRLLFENAKGKNNT